MNYLGAYLDIELKEFRIKQCTDHGKVRGYNFCHICGRGLEVSEEMYVNSEDIKLTNFIVMKGSEIKKNQIILVPPFSAQTSVSFDDETEFKLLTQNFPREAINTFKSIHHKVITSLEDQPEVENIEVKFGYYKR